MTWTHAELDMQKALTDRTLQVHRRRRTHGKEVWRKKCRQRDISRGRWRQQQKTELDRDK